MAYNANIPQPTDLLSNSQSDLLANFIALDGGFGIDHYNFSNATTNRGKHQHVTTPNLGAHPTTVANEPRFYGTLDTAPLGVMQYTRQGNDAKPSPVSYIQSSIAAINLANNATQVILDFAGITYANGFFTATDTAVTPGQMLFYFVWNGSNFTKSFSIDSSGILFSPDGGNPTFFRIQNVSGSAFANLYWTMQFFRINT